MQARSAALLAATFLAGLGLAPAHAAEAPAPQAAYAQYVQAQPQARIGRQGGYEAAQPQARIRDGRAYGRGRGYVRDRRGPSGGAVAAGVIGGLAAGALIGGAIANSQPAAAARPPGLVDPEVADWCAARYRTYDYRSGTYLSPSGERLVCVP